MKAQSTTKFFKACLGAAFITVLLFSNSIKAQDVHFTQFYHNPLLLNPAQTGLACNWRAGINYRNQWASVTTPYVTFAGYFDNAIYFNNKRNSSLGYGLSLYNDRAGDGVLNTIEVNPSVALHLALGADHPKKYKLSIGIQPSFRNRSVNVNNLTWNAQYNTNTGQLMSNWPSGQNLTNTSFTVFDMNSGIQFSAAPTEEVNFWFGASAFHILQPNESFYSTTSTTLPMRTMLNAGARFIVNDAWTILPNALYFQQAKAQELNVGLDFDYTVNPRAVEPFALVVGPYYRFKDAFQLLLGGEYKGYRVGITYDINASSLRLASHYKGGLELAITYKSPCRLVPYHINKMFVCPRF